MDNKYKDKRIAGLKQASHKKRQEALVKTEKAVQQLIDTKQKINIRAVARVAGVSVSYIYKHPELSYKIQSLRDAQKYDSDGNKILPNVGNSSLKKEDEEIELRQEIECLKTYISNIKGNKKSLTQLREENMNLQLENKKLKQELEFTQQILAETRNFILSQGYNNTQDKTKSETRRRVVKQITQDTTKVSE